MTILRVKSDIIYATGKPIRMTTIENITIALKMKKTMNDSFIIASSLKPA